MAIGVAALCLAKGTIMSLFNQLALAPGMGAFDNAFYNYGGSAIPVGTPVTVDATNFIGNGATANQVGIVAVGATGNPGIGVTMESIPAGGAGRVRCFGPMVAGAADAAITAGGVVDFSATAARTFKAHAAGKFQAGVALSAAADNDQVLVLMFGANNA